MRESCTLYVGLDIHKDSLDIAVADEPRNAEVCRPGTVAGGVDAVTKSLRKLVTGKHRLHIVYESGACGFVLRRHFAAPGWHFDVVAPLSPATSSSPNGTRRCLPTACWPAPPWSACVTTPTALCTTARADTLLDR